MFWYMLLAHFLGDYPLQSDWMVANRRRLPVRLLHGAIHFALLALLTYTVVARTWPFYLVLVIVHVAIDTGKIWITPRLPRWSTWLYFLDQLVHLSVIGLVAYWIGRVVPPGPLPLNRLIVLCGIGFLLVTYVWMITERILLARRPGSEDLSARAWPRAFIRAGLLAAVLLGWAALFPAASSERSSAGDTGGLALPPASAGLVIHPPYPATRTGLRALLVDVLVTLAVAAFIIVTNR